MTVANFIIGGTEKAGTTSVFSYLAQHPEVVVSRRKETDFFRREGGSLAEYASCFPGRADARVVAEASPAYLGESRQVAPRMRQLLPDVKLLFILRDPVDRFLSSFHFHRAKLNLPPDLAFGRYLDACLAYVHHGCHSGRLAPDATAGLADWFLDVLPFGCYATHLRPFLAEFPRHNVKVAFYDDLRSDARTFMHDLGDFLELSPRYWDDVDFEPANVTFFSRHRGLHRAAVWVNDCLEPVLRPRPRLKQKMVSLYKRVNAARQGYDGMSADDRERLEAFYAPHNRELQALLDVPLPEGWSMASPDVPLGRRTQRSGAVST